MEAAVTSIKKNPDRLRRNNNIGFHTFRSGSTAGLRQGASEDYDAVFTGVFEEFEFLLRLNDGVKNVFAGDVGFNVACSTILVSKKVKGVADLLVRWHIDGDEFSMAAFFGG